MSYFRENALLDYFSGGFDGAGEGLLLVHGSISRSLAPSFMERMQRVAQDFAQQHLAPDGHPKLLHLWPPKLPQAGRLNYQLFGLSGSGFLSW